MVGFESSTTLFGLLYGTQHQMEAQLSGGKFSFKRVTNELAIDYGQMSFIGNCIAVL